MDSEQTSHRIQPVATWTDRALEAAAAACVLGAVVYAYVSYDHLPARVPLHFDLAGNPDGYGSRASIFLLPAVALFVYAIMTGVGLIKPWFWNIPVKVTRENARRVYTIMSRLMRIIKVQVMSLICLVLWLVVASAHAGHTRGAWLPLVGAGALVVTVVAGMVMVRQQARGAGSQTAPLEGAGSHS